MQEELKEYRIRKYEKKKESKWKKKQEEFYLNRERMQFGKYIKNYKYIELVNIGGI